MKEIDIQLTSDSKDPHPFHKKQPCALSSSSSMKRDERLKATIPEGALAFLELKAGDKLEWRMDIKDGEKVAVVKKLERGQFMSDAEAEAYRKMQEERRKKRKDLTFGEIIDEALREWLKKQIPK